jgi:hypothetical protein
MSARLFVEGYEVDILNEMDVDFTYSVSDISDIERRNTSFSKTIVLPSTTRNQKLFGNIFDVSVQNDYYHPDPNILSNFNPAKQALAQIFLDNVKIFDGVLRLIKINNKNGDITYEVNVFGKLKDILHVLGDSTLADLDFTDYDHIWSAANIQNSWSRDMWVDGGNNYVYPMVDYGDTLNGVQYPLLGFKPAVFLREILKRIFAESGFQINSPFLESNYFKKLILITAEKSITKQVTTLLKQTAGFIQPAAQINNINYLVRFTSVINDGFTITNNGGNFNWARVQTITTSIKYIANFRFSALAPTSVRWRLSVRKNGGEILFQEVVVTFTAQNQQYFWDVDLSQAFDLIQNDDFEVHLVGQKEPSSAHINTIIQCIQSELTIGNLVPIAVDVIEGDTMKIGYILPKSMKQRDFLKSIITMHNLYIESDPLLENVLQITPYTQFYDYDKTNAVDWTNKLDYSQNISVTPLSELTAKEYRIGFDTDTDYWSEFYRAKYNEGYGESITILDNDFELDTKTLKVVFGSPVMREEIAGRIMLHLYKVQNGVKIKDNFKPRIANWRPNTPCPTSWTLLANSGNLTYTTYPYAGHLDDPINPVSDYLFGTPREVYFTITQYPAVNMYVAYYKLQIDEIGDKDSKLLVGKFYLTPNDIMNLDFRKLVKVGNHYYKLQKVDKYNPIGDVLAEVHLFKVLNNLTIGETGFILLENDSFMLQENGISKFYI